MTDTALRHLHRAARVWRDAALNLFRPDSAALDGLDEEIAHHLECLERDQLILGVPESRSGAEAERLFGNPARVRRRTVRILNLEKRMIRAVACVALLGLSVTVLAGVSSAQRPAWKKVAPFTALRLDGDHVLIRHDGAWWRLRSIDGVAASDLTAAARDEFGSGFVEKRMAEDIHEVMRAAGRTPGERVLLHVEPEEGGPGRLFHGVAMTEDKRREAWTFRNDLDLPEPCLGFDAPPRARVGDWREVAPFTGLRLQGDSIVVRHEGAWWTLLAIDGIGADVLRLVSERAFGHERAEKRLAEDIHEVLVAAGWEPTDTDKVDLLLAIDKASEPVLFEGVAMTHDKRRQAYRLRHPD